MQLVDDILDFTGSSTILGKPALNDLASGIATAPVLFAAQEQPVRNRWIDRDPALDGSAIRIATSGIATVPVDFAAQEQPVHDILSLHSCIQAILLLGSCNRRFPVLLAAQKQAAAPAAWCMRRNKAGQA